MHTRFFAFYSMYRLESIICCVDQISQTERNMKERDRGTRASSVGGWREETFESVRGEERESMCVCMSVVVLRGYRRKREESDEMDHSELNFSAGGRE